MNTRRAKKSAAWLMAALCLISLAPAGAGA
jgi:hypothetical protein